MGKKKLASTDGFMVRGWMVRELHLKGGDLFAFALIYQFVQSIAGVYKGNTTYLSEWTGWSERTSRAHLKALQERGLIIELRGRENNSPYCFYQLGPAFHEVFKCIPQKLLGEGENNATSTPQKVPETPRKKCGEKVHRESTVEFTPPSPQEVADYVRSRGWSDPEGFAKYYIDYRTEFGWKMTNGKKIQNWKLNVVSWEPHNKTRTFSTPQPPASPAATGPLRQMTDEEFCAMMKQ